MSKIDSTFGERVRATREDRGYTLTALAERLGLGVSVLSKLETGKLPWSLERAQAVADALDVPLGQMFGGGQVKAGMLLTEKERDVVLEMRRDPPDELEVTSPASTRQFITSPIRPFATATICSASSASFAIASRSVSISPPKKVRRSIQQHQDRNEWPHRQN